MQNQPRFIVYVVFSPERGPETLHEPMTFSNLEEARRIYTTFPKGKVTLRQDTFMENGCVLHVDISDMAEPISTLAPFSLSASLQSTNDVPADDNSDVKEKEALIKTALESPNRKSAVEAILDTMNEDCPFILNPEEFFPEGEYGHLKRALTADEANMRSAFQAAGDRFFLEWLVANMSKMSNDQICKTIAWHSDKDLGERFWASLKQRLDELH